jgi:hypothetical protein
MFIFKQNYIMIFLQTGWRQLCYEADYITLGRGRMILGFPLYIIVSFGTLVQECPLGGNPSQLISPTPYVPLHHRNKTGVTQKEETKLIQDLSPGLVDPGFCKRAE